MKFNKKKLVALMLTGGIALVGSPKNVRADDLNVNEIVEMCESKITRNMTYEEFCIMCYNACNSLNNIGLNVSIDELYSTIYITNFTYMSEDVRKQIIDAGYVSGDVFELINNSNSILGMMATHNDNLFIKSLDNNAQINYSQMAHSADLCYNQKDKEISDKFDTLLIDYINTGKRDCNLLTELYKGYTKIPNESKYSIEQASIGAEYSINRTSGWVFYFHTSPMHPVDGSSILDEESLNALASYLEDASSVVTSLGYKCKTK